MRLFMRNKILAVALLATLSGTPTQGGAAQIKPSVCPIDRVIYRQLGNPETTAGFARQGVRTSYASDLVFWVRGGGQTFWFGLASPNGYGGTHLYQRIAPSAVKPAAEEGATPIDTLPDTAGEDGETATVDFDAFDAAMKANPAPPQSKDRSPNFIFARGLGPLFHYAHNGNRYIVLPADKSVRIDIAMWRPAECSLKPHRG
jgi:hypothetical protein